MAGRAVLRAGRQADECRSRLAPQWSRAAFCSLGHEAQRSHFALLDGAVNEALIEVEAERQAASVGERRQQRRGAFGAAAATSVAIGR